LQFLFLERRDVCGGCVWAFWDWSGWWFCIGRFFGIALRERAYIHSMWIVREKGG
jgi:hypothetical protein